MELHALVDFSVTISAKFAPPRYSSLFLSGSLAWSHFTSLTRQDPHGAFASFGSALSSRDVLEELQQTFLARLNEKGISNIFDAGKVGMRGSELFCRLSFLFRSSSHDSLFAEGFFRDHLLVADPALSSLPEASSRSATSKPDPELWRANKVKRGRRSWSNATERSIGSLADAATVNVLQVQVLLSLMLPTLPRPCIQCFIGSHERVSVCRSHFDSHPQTKTSYVSWLIWSPEVRARSCQG